MSELSYPTTPPRAGAARGCVTVGDYLGVPAAAAARAVRRVGLTPGLERQFDGEPGTVGLVVAQEPQGGGEAPRGSMVTLYVSAPAPTAQRHEQYASETPGAVTDPSPEPASLPASPPEESPRVRPAKRKRGVRPAGVAQQGTPPAGAAATVAPPQPAEQPGLEPDEQPGTGSLTGEPGWEELTFELRDTFQTAAAAAGPGGVYPRVPLRLRVLAARRWLAGHRTAVVLVCGLVGLSVLLAITGAGASGGAAPRVATSSPPQRSTPRASDPDRTRRHAARRARRTRARVPGPRPAPERPVAGRTGPLGPAPQPAVTEGPPEQTASTAPEPAAQSGGGPFSP